MNRPPDNLSAFETVTHEQGVSFLCRIFQSSIESYGEPAGKLQRRAAVQCPQKKAAVSACTRPTAASTAKAESEANSPNVVLGVDQSPRMSCSLMELVSSSNRRACASSVGFAIL
jgi:hypothetical protein